MKKSFTNEQIVAALRQAEGGVPGIEVCRKMGITEQTFYRWKRKFSGMGIAELARLRQLEDENRKLKSLVADLSLDKHMLQEVLRKKVTSMAQWGGFLGLMLGLFFFSGIGNASTFKQMPMIFPPRQAGGVIGWTSAIAAYGPFVFSVLLGTIMGTGKNASSFFVGLAVFYVINLLINWWFYARPGAEKPC